MDERERRRASLIEFLEAARAHGASDDLLANLLERRGWSRKDIYNAFGSVYERLTGLELPGRGARSAESARDAFLYLLSFGTLATWAEHMGHDEAAELLRQTEDEESAADEKLTEVAENIANQRAQAE